MPEHPSITEFGVPALKIAGLQLWIHGRERPEAMGADDGNWLCVTAHCGSSGASVFASGAILRVEVTPEPLHQKHVFDFEIDQSHLPGLIAECERIARAYPVRGAWSN